MYKRESVGKAIIIVRTDQLVTPVAELTEVVIVMFAGQAMVGGVKSDTRTVKVQLAELPAASFAKHVVTVDPKGKVDPEAGEQITDAT